jgi:acetolactate synthase I/II/III large subunit
MSGERTSGPTTAAEAYLAALHANGIQYVFANGGTDFAPIIEALVRMRADGREAPHFITVPHENVAMAAAQGYSKISHRASVVMVHVNVGTANCVCGVMNASRDNVPVLLAAGRTPLTEFGHVGSRDNNIHWTQENFDQAAIVREHVKWDYELRGRQPVNSVVARALDIAMSEPRGPVYLTLPREVLGDELADAGPAPRPRPLGALSPAPAIEGIDQAASWLARAESPLLVAGRSGRLPGAFEALGELALEYALPVMTGEVSSNIATSNPMWLGIQTPKALAEADVIVAIDAAVPWIPKNVKLRDDVKLIHIAHDPFFARIPYRGYQMDLAIAGDPVAALKMLREAMRTEAAAANRTISARRERIKERRAQFEAAREAEIERSLSSRPINSIMAAHAINQVKGKKDIVVAELGAAYSYLDFEEPGCLLGTSSGGLGMGLGHALGAKLAAPDRQVIATVGDGSYMFGCPTAAHFVGRNEKLPTLTMIMNNSQWYAVKAAALRMYPTGQASRTNSLPVVDLSPSPDFEKIIEACGGYGERVEEPAKLVPAIERAYKKMQDGISVTLNVVSGDRTK